MDIQPVNPGHMLVVPAEHHVGLEDLPSEVGNTMFSVAQKVGGALKSSGLRCEGVNLFFAGGKAAMQEAFHAHLYVFPRFAADGFGPQFPVGYCRRPARRVLEAAAAKIRTGLNDQGNA